MEKRFQKGQTLLIVILSTIVALTVGLSIATRTITNLKISKQNEESQRAFQAAEAGVERVLKQYQDTGLNSITTNDTLSNNSQFATTLTTASGTSFSLNAANAVDQDLGTEVWLSKYPDFSAPQYSGTISFYWGTSDQILCSGSGDAVAPALEVIVLSGTSKTSPTLSKYLFDSCAGRTQGTLGALLVGNSFSTTDGGQFAHGATLPSVSNGFIIKVVPLYNSAKIGISGSSAFPSQGTVVASRGTSGDTARKIVFFNSYPQIPIEIFPYAILSQ